MQFVLSAVVFAQAAMAADRPVVTRWMDPSGQPRPSHVPAPGKGSLKMAGEATKALRGFAPPGIETNRICVIVHSNVYASISNQLAQYQADLQEDGFSPIMYRYDSGTAEDLRTYLAGLYGEPNSLKGTVLIGDIPYIIFEMSDNFSGSDYGYDDFPCDLFYMDLNGTWLDQTNGGDFAAGKYDTRTGNLDAEIWVGRMKTSNLSGLGNQTNLLIHYFDKNHRYRAGRLVPNRRALVYDDDDWDYMAYDDAQSLAGIYGDTHAAGVRDAETTRADDYKSAHMTRSYDLMMVRSHGYPGGHGFYTNGRAQFDYVYSSDYRNLTPPALFYSFYVCSGSDFASADNLAGTAAFNTNDSGLVSWGSAKTGGMLDDDRFYGPIASGEAIGEAFRQWLNYAQPLTDGPAWFWGMVVIGDGTLRPGRTRFSPSEISARGDGFVSQWTVVAGDKYCLQQVTNLVAAAWTNVGGVITASVYGVGFTNSAEGGAVRFYRLVEDKSGPANLLGNAGFEMPGSTDRYARDWQWSFPDSHGSVWDNAYRESWRAHGDFWEVVVRGGWSGGMTNGGWWQEVEASAGATYRASAWFWADETWTASSQELKIEFYSSSFGAALSTNIVDLSDVGETWTQKTVTAVAPASTAWARFVVGVTGAGYDGALQFDDAELVRE